jgi:hypothetical protein
MGVLVIVALTGTALVAAGIATLVWLRFRRRRLPLALRGDWWPRFEEAFRDYVRRSSESAPETER